MDGATTLSEEHELYAYFHGNAVADDLQQMRELFLGLESLDGLGKQQKAEERPKPVARRLRLRPWLTAVAATLLTLIVVSAAVAMSTIGVTRIVAEVSPAGIVTEPSLST